MYDDISFPLGSQEGWVARIDEEGSVQQAEMTVRLRQTVWETIQDCV